MKRAPQTSPMLDAALAFAARGWPVFPCNTANKQPLLAAAKDPKTGQKIKGTGGVSRASVHEQEIRTWWKKWPLAMVGLATGHAELFEDGKPGAVNRRLFVLDFDPRHDPETGEEYTLERLKAETEAQIGCALRATLAARTPSGGVHLYYVTPDDGGAPIRNRGNLPLHVDVRGLGGYVIAPPSVMEDCRRYRWLHGAADAPIAEAPAALIAELRAPKRKESPPDGSGRTARPVSPSPPLPADMDDAARDAVRKYALSGLDAELQAVRSAPSGRRNAQLNESALKIAGLVAAGALDATLARFSLEAAARENPGRDDDGQLLATIDSGWSAGLNNPRDLAEVAAAARLRASRPRRSSAGMRHPSGRPPPDTPARPRTGGDDDQSQSFRSGRLDREPNGGGGAGVAPRALSEAETARLMRIAEHWLKGRLEHVAREAKALTQLAWSIGRRVSAGLLDVGEAKEALWPLCEDVADVQHADIDRAIDDGIARGFDPEPALMDLMLSGYPMTDFGIAERFRDRHGHNFRFTTGKGWLGWDERRWKVLDQDKDTLPAELISAVFETIRDIQREARRVAETGVKWSLIKDGKEQRLDLDDEGNPHGLDRWVAKGKTFILFSEMLRIFGRQSEQVGKPASVANLARRWLTVPIEEFDRDKLAINVMNGTLRFAREALPDGGSSASVRLERHKREDLLTKLAPVDYDPAAPAPLYEAMFEWAQELPAMRRYLHQVAGYAMTGETGEHKLWFNYGRGRNGKSTTIDSWCAALGDYSGTTLIETFLDQGIKKRGDQASPDLARLGGVRMLRASEPERGAKLNSALIKFVTGGEPVPVRALHRGFFDLLPQFKLLMSGNSKPDIPDTDEGIWGRMKLVPWLRNIDQPPDGAVNWPKKDERLGDKIKAGELAGVFNHLVRGLLDYLAHGFVEPAEVKAATQAYRDDSDPLARFLRLCTEHDPGGRVQSSKLHEVFVAWCKAAGEKEWTQKGFSKAMADKGFAKKASDGMQWLGLKLVRQATDFVDENGRVRALPDDMALEPPSPSPDAPLWAGGPGGTRPPIRAPDDDDEDFLP
ncbi:MAG TPA: phage/plasmid primase, P4 family [Allosphingosinicella sp.]|jgi:putative DNA primase/helicase